MSTCISFDAGGRQLEDFSAPHVLAMLIIFAACILFALICRSLHNEGIKKKVRLVFAVLLIIQQASIYVWYGVSGDWSAAVTLPLQLCDISLFLSILLMFVKNRYLTEVLYFWGLGGATQAILTPDIGNYTFPHFVFYQFFVSHAFILMAVLYLVVAEGFRPNLRSVVRVLIVTNIYAAVIFPVNYITGGNYLFLRVKPAGGSLLDILGPWPWYIASLEGVAAVIFLILYLPFAFAGRRSQRRSASTLNS